MKKVVVKPKISILNKLRLQRIQKIVNEINNKKAYYAQLSDKELSHQTLILKNRLSSGESLDDILVDAFAVIREANKRILGLFPYDAQVMGAIALHQGTIAEMKTGEGKTLTATMPLYLNALTGKGAILVTTNDYLAKRDALEMGKVYRFLGMTVGINVFDKKEEADATIKREVYESDITYTTAGALGFDYLVHNLASNKLEQFLRPFHFVIVDEADSVLLDIAQTPLIIAGDPRVQSNLYGITNNFVLTLKENDEYIHKAKDKIVYLTEKGVSYAKQYFNISELYNDEYWELNRHINLALRAHCLYKRDYDYVVKNNEVKLLDNATGRVMEGTKLQSGIHQAIEAKEDVALTNESRAIASITYQSLFNMFPRLSGMTGTGKTSEDELIKTYHLPVIVIPTNFPIKRVDLADKIYVSLPEKLQATIDDVKQRHSKGQPVLLISGTVEIANIYSKLLLREGIAHNTLTADNVVKEAQIIKEAGQKGSVTCATVLAGRGTDIKLGEGVRELGGLAVIGTERMPNLRMDWQLRGRSGRQGDPGISQFYVSLEDELIVSHSPEWVIKYLKKYSRKETSNYYMVPRKKRFFYQIVKNAQLRSEDKGVSSREQTIKFGESLRIQRENIYQLRNELIADSSIVVDGVIKIIQDNFNDIANDKDLTEHSLRRYILENLTYKFKYFPDEFDVHNSDDVFKLLIDIFDREFTAKKTKLQSDNEFDNFVRISILKAIDKSWIEEVDSLQQLKGVVTNRGIGQRDIIQEYYKESLNSYYKMGKEIRYSIVKNIMLSTISKASDGSYSIYYV
ncbi:accessory Sec system translocase SecA2 [Streptococcus agalactiae]|uniref:Protein translocase subunit SecA n=1 Tax=Streptococcus agalactiae MRI Z1-216 TaxID=1154879 RepID=A0AAD2WV21_STRAG|nr:accessory Sec system translocase SecA2 [Streptococcus agalactiae]EPT40253.1 preprotein translocase subunit SecA [Streptococcus agalactiae FSL C1-494]EPT45610.1 preprotein translocase subunit SecA [Streptococcus agalactiae FSL S3-170]EPU32630.1 preprotein translocase subunit SecA [Streptococcus agalactiae MRI Z1-213]EPU34639.1 preprotein translocase subunit SecA [Streptococcus agalactiae MRI Z1-214]EPU38219.1 preprotein translocase subunit SecA [Streptococcus agalactiae MRI Z1-216]